jgi:hypothetical protein
MRKVLSLVVVIIAAISTSAQSEQNLKQYFEGKTVSLKIDMPATRDAVNVYPERENPLEYSEYASRLKRYGTSVHRGDETTVSKIKVKDKLIEFQLSGAPHGTMGNETGARFNIHFSLVDPTILPPDAVVVALRRYVDFSGIEDSEETASYLEPTSYSFPADDFKPGVLQVGPRTTYLKEGLSTEEVVRLLGTPSAVFECVVDDIVVTTYEFPRGEGRVLIADFVKDMLIHSTIETRAQIAQVGR